MRFGDRKNARAMIVLLLVAGTGFLGLRVVRTMHEISAGRNEAAAAANSAGNSRLEKMTRAMDDRRELRVAVASLARDPFRAPSAMRAAESGAAPTRTAEAQVAGPVPALRALVYDNVRPSVQLACEDVISPWLGQGDTFKGWTVLEIGPGSVWIRNGSRKQELGLN